MLKFAVTCFADRDGRGTLDSANETGESARKRQATWDAARHSMLSLLCRPLRRSVAMGAAGNAAAAELRPCFPYPGSKSRDGWSAGTGANHYDEPARTLSLAACFQARGVVPPPAIGGYCQMG